MVEIHGNISSEWHFSFLPLTPKWTTRLSPTQTTQRDNSDHGCTNSSLTSVLWTHADQSEEEKSKVEAASVSFYPFLLICSLNSNEKKCIFMMEIESIDDQFLESNQ